MRFVRSIGFVVAGLAACTGSHPSTDVAGTDASVDTVSDIAADVTICTEDRQCGDDVFCNGSERCAPGAKGADARGCVAASAPACGVGETCNEASARCDSACADADRDGHGVMPCGDDCDDNDANRFPGNTEVCTFDADAGVRVDPAHDEDCDGNTYANATAHDGDRDGDNHIDRSCCNPDGSGGFRCGDDCADLQPVPAAAPFNAPLPAASIHPTQAEVCNGVDDNCNGAIDESLPVNTFAPDCDGDNFGDMTATTARSCSTEAFPACNGHPVVPNVGDCDDTNPAVHTGAPEQCDGAHVDENCNGEPNEMCPCSGSESQGCCNGRGTQICTGGAWGACSTPSVPELCNAADDNCNGVVDDLPGATCIYGTSRNNPACGVYPCTQQCGSECQWANTCTLASTTFSYSVPESVQINGGAAPCSGGLPGICAGGASWSSFWVFAPNPSLPLPAGTYTASVGAAVGGTDCNVTIRPIVTFIGAMWSGEQLDTPRTLTFPAGTIGSQTATFNIGIAATSETPPCGYNMTFELRGSGNCEFFRLVDFAILRAGATVGL